MAVECYSCSRVGVACAGGGRSSRATPSLRGDDRWSDIKNTAVEPFQIIKYQYLHFNYPLPAPPGPCQGACVGMCHCQLHWDHIFLTLYRDMSTAQVFWFAREFNGETETVYSYYPWCFHSIIIISIYFPLILWSLHLMLSSNIIVLTQAGMTAVCVC